MDAKAPKLSLDQYVQALQQLLQTPNVPENVRSTFSSFTLYILKSEVEDAYTNPTSWIGLSIVGASLICILAFLGDLVHGIRNKKFWFPCNYFVINSFFQSIIPVAVTLAMDITTGMPGAVDKSAKLGGLAFLCTCMANALPSLATHNDKQTLENIMGLVFMVIVLFSYIFIQIRTGILSYVGMDRLLKQVKEYFPHEYDRVKLMHDRNNNNKMAVVFLVLLFVLLLIHLCSSLANSTSKKIIDVKYQRLHETLLQETRSDRSTVEQVGQLVRKYGIMAETGSPQFITSCYVTTSVSGLISFVSLALHYCIFLWAIHHDSGVYESDYKWATKLILIIQFIGSNVGTIAPVCRCFSMLCFEVSIRSIKHHIMVFKLESYWVGKLYEWKQRTITLPFRSHKAKVITEYVKLFSINFGIILVNVILALGKILFLIPCFLICVIYCLKSTKEKGKVIVSRCRNEPSLEAANGNEDGENLRRYVLQLDEMAEISRRTYKIIKRSTERFIRMGERRQSKTLLDFIKESRSFEGDQDFVGDQVPSLFSRENSDCWSLSVATLTAISVSLPRIEKRKIDKLLSSVGDGLQYTTVVEETLNTTKEWKTIQKAAATLWNEIEVYKTWLNNNMQDLASQKNTTREIVELFKEKGQDMVKEVERCGDDNSSKSICANSMVGVTDVILLSKRIDTFNQQQLFDHISKMISRILAVSLSNLPKVIVMKCHSNNPEKREETVQAAARLLGETTQLINTLQDGAF